MYGSLRNEWHIFEFTPFIVLRVFSFAIQAMTVQHSGSDNSRVEAKTNANAELSVGEHSAIFSKTSPSNIRSVLNWDCWIAISCNFWAEINKWIHVFECLVAKRNVWQFRLLCLHFSQLDYAVGHCSLSTGRLSLSTTSAPAAFVHHLWSMRQSFRKQAYFYSYYNIVL